MFPFPHVALPARERYLSELPSGNAGPFCYQSCKANAHSRTANSIQSRSHTHFRYIVRNTHNPQHEFRVAEKTLERKEETTLYYDNKPFDSCVLPGNRQRHSKTEIICFCAEIVLVQHQARII